MYFFVYNHLHSNDIKYSYLLLIIYTQLYGFMYSYPISRDELIRDVLLWTPTHGRAKAGRPARTYIQQLCEDTECCPEDLPRAMNDREEWRERFRDIHATSAIWWWWWYLYTVYIIDIVHILKVYIILFMFYTVYTVYLSILLIMFIYYMLGYPYTLNNQQWHWNAWNHRLNKWI